MKKLLILIITLYSQVAFAAYIPSAVTKIKNVSSYNDFGDGDVVFKLENPISECSHGYWISKSDKGYNANLTMIIAAYQAKNSVLIYGLPDQLWAGSSGKYCKLYTIDLL